MTISILSRAISEEEWSEALRIIQSEPDVARIWSKHDGLFGSKSDTNLLPIHEAVIAKAPYKIVKALIRAYPESLSQGETANKRLPLHCACRANAQDDIIELLVAKNVGACLVEDSLDRFPLHYALTNGASPEVLHILINAAPDSAKGCDFSGWTPAHVALKVDARASIVKELLEFNPDAAHMRTERGTSISKMIPKKSENKAELQEIVDEAKGVTEPRRESKLEVI